MLIRRPVASLLFFLLILCAAQSNLCAAQAEEGQSDWRAMVKVDNAAVYSEVSTASKVVKTLARGDAVKINLEIVGVDGAWYGISEAGKAEQLGYVQGRFIETEPPLDLANWSFLPPPEPVEPAVDATVTESKPKSRVYFAKDQAAEEIRKFFISRFGRSLPVSAFGQSTLHNRLGFDHRNGIDVALHPDSYEGRALLSFLRTRGIPFIAFRHPVRGIATGAHIHVGNPSPRR